MARKREFDQTAVLEKAMFLFWEKGFEATSVHDLKQAMGISTSSMYETFGDKRGIYLAALAYFCELERERFRTLAQETPSASQLIAFLFDAIETLAQHADEQSGSFAFNAMVEFGSRDTAVTDLIFTHYFQIAAIIAEALAQAQAANTITRQYTPQQLAHFILSTLHGVAAVKGAMPNYSYTQPTKQIILHILED